MLVIRPMRVSDVPGVMAIEERVCEFPWTASIFADCIKVGYSCWVIDDETKIVGYALLSASAGEAHVLNICIHPERQHQGYGRRLMRHLIQTAIDMSCELIYLEVRFSNVNAIALYQQLGFQLVGERKDYYPHKDGRENAWVYSMNLPKEPAPAPDVPTAS